MGYSDTKTEGPAANAVSAMLTLLGKRHGTNDAQAKSILSELVKQTPADAEPPTTAQWAQWLTAAHEIVEGTNLTNFRRANLHARLDAAAASTPSARIWFALQNLDKDAAARMAALDGYLAQITRINGSTIETVREEFATRVANVGSARANGEGRQTRTTFHGHIPADYATVTVLADMRREAVQAADIHVVKHITLPAGVISSYGYSESDSRFEVNMAGSVYAYRVPAEVAEKIANLDHATDQVGGFIVRNILPNAAYEWEAGQSAMRVCPACSVPVAQVHLCNGPATAPYEQGVLVDLDPGAERIGEDGTVMVLLRANAIRNELITTGAVVFPIVAITPADEASGALGARHIVKGDVEIDGDDVRVDALSCSCPATQCAHMAVAADQARHLVMWGSLPSAASFITA